uniref:Uncharacterized protein n=1 Tax=Onchocerca volvulus TaxID=6282 RepID=A0A8R1XYL3_ONCVO
MERFSGFGTVLFRNADARKLTRKFDISTHLFNILELLTYESVALQQNFLFLRVCGRIYV